MCIKDCLLKENNMNVTATEFFNSLLNLSGEEKKLFQKLNVIVFNEGYLMKLISINSKDINQTKLELFSLQIELRSLIKSNKNSKTLKNIDNSIQGLIEYLLSIEFNERHKERLELLQTSIKNLKGEVYKYQEECSIIKRFLLNNTVKISILVILSVLYFLKTILCK